MESRKKNSEYNINTEFIIKKAYLEGALDGRLFSYLNNMEPNQSIADDIFSETVDYLTLRELIKNIDQFYNDPLNNYIPIPSAIIIANMYAKRMNMENIDDYIRSTREWINSLILDLDSLNYSELLEQKSVKYNKTNLIYSNKTGFFMPSKYSIVSKKLNFRNIELVIRRFFIA